MKNKEFFSLYGLIIVFGLCIVFVASDVSAYTLRFMGEYERTELSGSLINPENILERPTDRVESVIIYERADELWSGQMSVNFRGSYLYLDGPYSPSHHSAFRGRFNELYYKRDLGNISVTLGRKRVRWGVGYASSPTDLITQLRTANDPDDRLQRVDGTEIFQLSAISSDSQFDIVYFPELTENLRGWDMDNGWDRYEQTRVGVRYYRYIDPFDLSIVGKVEQRDQWAAGLNSSVTVGDALELHAEYLFTNRNDTLYPGQLRFTLPFSLPYSTKDNNVHDVLVGGQYTFSYDWNLTLEYIFRSAGYSETEWNEYTDHVTLLHDNLALIRSLSLFEVEDFASVTTVAMRKHHMFARLYKPDILPSLSFEWFGLASLEDGSGLQTLHTEYSASDLYNIYLRIEHFWGHSTSELGLVPDEVKGIIGFSMFFGSEE